MDVERERDEVDDGKPPEHSLRSAFRSWRTAAVALQSFPSGLPLGLILTAIPGWLAKEGVDIKTIGFITLAQIPWTFKFLWSPFMDRYAPPFLGRKRGWAAIAQVGLFISMLLLAAAARDPSDVWLIAGISLLIAFFAASQDIAIDAYAVEVLHKDEQGVASGARSAVSRLALFLSGRVMISLSPWLGWPRIFLLQAFVYPFAVLLMVFSPEPEQKPVAPTSLRDAVWEPLVAYLRQNHAIQITVFLVLYKFGDNLASALITPFLFQAGFNEFDVGIAQGTIGMIGTIVGALVGGAITTAFGLGHSLWLFGFLQAFSNLGYVLLAQAGPDRLVMYGAIAVETVTSGMGTGAFSVLLLRLTAREFSATQYALLSSVFALGRTISPPLAGVMVDALGWTTFFALTIVAAVPGMAMLHLFVPLGTQEPVLRAPTRSPGAPLTRGELLVRAVIAAPLGTAAAAVLTATLEAFRRMRTDAAVGFDLVTPFLSLFSPVGVGGWVTVVGILLCGLMCGLVAAALPAARRGIKQ